MLQTLKMNTCPMKRKKNKLLLTATGTDLGGVHPPTSLNLTSHLRAKSACRTVKTFFVQNLEKIKTFCPEDLIIIIFFFEITSNSGENNASIINHKHPKF